MKVKCCGATEGVTGSNFLVESENNKFLVDCGLFQGSLENDRRNWEELPYNPKEIDFIILTHSHIDHIGRLPLLYKKGFRGKVYCTRPVYAFSELFLEDASRNLKDIAEKLGLEPLFSEEDVKNVLKLYETFDYYKVIRPQKDIEIKFYDAGHILGSAIVEVKIGRKVLVFSGDLGNSPVAILKNTDFLSYADYIFLESTYGDRNHRSPKERKILLERSIEETFSKKGVLLIPAFAMERTQEILYEIHRLKKFSRIPDIPIYIDSPLAYKATLIYKKFPQYFNRKARELVERGEDLFNFPNLHFVKDEEESKELDRNFDPKVIIAGSGMSTGGRILFHEKIYLPKPSTTLLIVGFQAKGTLGRRLKDGEKRVEIEGEEVEVNSKIIEIESYSAHADQKRILYWLLKFDKRPKKIFLFHGEENAKIALKLKIKDRLGIDTEIPKFNEIIKL